MRDTDTTLDDLLDKRIVLITGKGGVGRSTLTAAIARVAQSRSRRVLLAEIGEEGHDYSPLARCFGRERLPDEPSEIGANLRGVTLLARTGQEKFLASVLHNATIARAALGSEALRRLLSAGPSFREMGVFFQLLTYLRERRSCGAHEHEFVIIDMPATGHTLSLTGLPQLLLRLLPRGPIAEALREGQSYLNDPVRSAAWVVTLPETLPVSECLELLDGLERTAMPAGGVILNRVPEDPFTPGEREALHPLVSGNRLFGAEGFTRHHRCCHEVRRLRAGTRLPLVSVPDVPGEGADVVVHVTRSLETVAACPGGAGPHAAMLGGTTL